MYSLYIQYTSIQQLPHDRVGGGGGGFEDHSLGVLIKYT